MRHGLLHRRQRRDRSQNHRQQIRPGICEPAPAGRPQPDECLFTMSNNTKITGPARARLVAIPMIWKNVSSHGQLLSPNPKPAINIAAGWWSQTGSNRRPPECKSGALPAELWPLANRQVNPKAQPANATRDALQRQKIREWWAWEDLNFRPHAYQARALTN